MTNDQLWGAIFLALGIFQAWCVFRALDTNNWSSLVGGWRAVEGERVPVLSADRHSQPIAFWIGVTWEAAAMILFVTLGAYELAPLILQALGR